MERFDGKYLGLTSFKHDGAGVATPVWFVSHTHRGRSPLESAAVGSPAHINARDSGPGWSPGRAVSRVFS
jgi:hypothetical protein